MTQGMVLAHDGGTQRSADRGPRVPPEKKDTARSDLDRNRMDFVCGVARALMDTPHSVRRRGF